MTFALERSAESRPIRYAELARALGVQRGKTAPLATVRATVIALRRTKGMVLDVTDPDTTSAGSFFTNPILGPGALREVLDRTRDLGGLPTFPEPDGRAKVSAAWLIERAGFTKGYTEGRVAVSSKHALALTNRGGAFTAELLALARTIRDGVRESVRGDARAGAGARRGCLARTPPRGARMKLDGKRILITGGGSGIGLALARRLAGANDVVITGRDEAKLDRARESTPSLRTMRLDVTSEEEAGSVLGRLAAELGGLDLLVNNAGVMRRRTLSASPEPTDELEINLGGTERMTRLALPLLRAQPEAGVLFMSSGVAVAAVPGFAVYAATKAAVHSFARSLRARSSTAHPCGCSRCCRRSWIQVSSRATWMCPSARRRPSPTRSSRRSGGDRLEIPIGPIRPLMWLARVAPRLADRIVLRSLGGFQAK